jgi:hypothetical protein
MPLIISDEALQAAHLSKEEMLAEIALALYVGERFTLAQAAHFAGLSRMEFQGVLPQDVLLFTTTVRNWKKTAARSRICGVRTRTLSLMPLSMPND